MRLVLDANEYIYALGDERKPSCERLFPAVIEGGHAVRLVRTIVQEVGRHLAADAMGDFFDLAAVVLEPGCGMDEDFVVPHHVAQHYQDIGFKEADAHIAAYAHVVEAEAVISENRRHFHALARHLPFRVMDAEQFLRRHPSAH